MSEVKHTPGPWMVHGLYGGHFMLTGPHRGRSFPAVAEVQCDNTPTGMANCHLIAAAPDLLEALILARKRLACAAYCQSAAEKGGHSDHVADYIAEQNEIHSIMEKAIAKATGTGESIGGGQ